VSQLTVFRDIEACALARSARLPAGTLRIMTRMTAVPNERCLTVPLIWNVRLEVDGRTAALTHCPDWHHVERRCSTLARIWAASHTELPASR
jgi:hypothetical protein